MNLDLLSENIRVRLRGTCLFYPASAGDLVEPVQLFAPCVRHFWFADTGYFQESGSIRSARPALARSDGVEFLSAEISESLIPDAEWTNDLKYAGTAPSIRAETYRHSESGELIVVNRHRRRGPTALRSLQEPLGVFFYRGDSREGSSTLWLTARRRGPNVLSEVLDRLVDGGVIATDGSNCLRRGNPYYHFAELAAACNREGEPRQGFTFSDPDGRCFTLVGCISLRWERSTLLWQVSRPTPA